MLQRSTDNGTLSHYHAIAAKNDVDATHERIDKSPRLESSVGQENSLLRASYRPPGSYPKTAVISGLATIRPELGETPYYTVQCALDLKSTVENLLPIRRLSVNNSPVQSRPTSAYVRGTKIPTELERETCGRSTSGWLATRFGVRPLGQRVWRVAPDPRLRKTRRRA